MFNFAVGSDLRRLGYLNFIGSIDSIVVLAFVATAVRPWRAPHPRAFFPDLASLTFLHLFGVFN